MSKSSLHNCQTCEHAIAESSSDCTSCKLASLMKASKDAKASADSKSEKPKKISIDQDDDYSISERLTEKGNDYSILYLFVAALFIFAFVILFTLLLS